MSEEKDIWESSEANKRLEELHDALRQVLDPDDYGWINRSTEVVIDDLIMAGVGMVSEVAEEIFAEIESLIKYFELPNGCALMSLVSLAELKKKYTGKGINVPAIEAVEGKKKIFPRWEYKESEDTE